MIDEGSVLNVFPCSEEDLDVHFRRENQFLDWERAGVLFDNHLISSQQGVYMELIIEREGMSRPIFEMEWAMFDDTGYINWIRLDEEFRGQGISKELRTMAVKGLFSNGCVEVFTIPASGSGEGLAKSQGFTKTNIQPSDEAFTVYSVTRNSWS